MTQKYLFIDRDGTLIVEPADYQIDSVEKFSLLPGVIPALLKLIEAGFKLVMVSNQDALGTALYPQEKFDVIQKLLLDILETQGITFNEILICPHTLADHCECRKPKVGLLMDYLREQRINRQHSYVIGDRQTDLELADNLGIKGLLMGDWPTITQTILGRDRIAQVSRHTKETQIELTVNLDRSEPIRIQTGNGFFDHMLELLAYHGKFSLDLSLMGDWHIDEHHSVEDVAIALGEAIRQALGDKRGIARYGFLLPMDESLAHIALDLSNRAAFSFKAPFTRDQVGDFPTEMVYHFFLSFSQSLAANLHISVEGSNNHHLIEAIFKGVGRTLQQAIAVSHQQIPSTKALL